MTPRRGNGRGVNFSSVPSAVITGTVMYQRVPLVKDASGVPTGLADATSVVESGEKGGALITADIANSYNRDVFAFPGRVSDRYSIGCNRLIKTNRAALMENVRDLEYLMNWQKTDKQPDGFQKTLFIELDEEEKILIGLLKNNTSLTIDQLALQSNLQVSRTSSVLLNLEFKGMVRCLPGKVFKIV